jgi:hypothetical protein
MAASHEVHLRGLGAGIAIFAAISFFVCGGAIAYHVC